MSANGPPTEECQAVARPNKIIWHSFGTPKDRHVLAAAVQANAEVIVTFNLSDFPEPALKPYDIAAVHPDELLLDQLDLYPCLTTSSRRADLVAQPSEMVSGCLTLG